MNAKQENKAWYEDRTVCPICGGKGILDNSKCTNCEDGVMLRFEIPSCSVTLFLADALFAMTNLIGNLGYTKSGISVVVDPPYGIGENWRRNVSRENLAKPTDYGEYAWDFERLPPEYIKAILSVSDSQVIFGGNFYTDLLPPSSGWIVWDKLNTGDFADCELAWTSSNKAVRKFTHMWNGFIRWKKERRYHPAQKPLDLMIWVIENYTKPDSVVLDPCMGSGTTGVACIQLGNRSFVGIDNDISSYTIAKERILESVSQRVFVFDL